MTPRSGSMDDAVDQTSAHTVDQASSDRIDWSDIADAFSRSVRRTIAVVITATAGWVALMALVQSLLRSGRPDAIAVMDRLWLCETTWGILSAGGCVLAVASSLPAWRAAGMLRNAAAKPEPSTQIDPSTVTEAAMSTNAATPTNASTQTGSSSPGRAVFHRRCASVLIVVAAAAMAIRSAGTVALFAVCGYYMGPLNDEASFGDPVADAMLRERRLIAIAVWTVAGYGVVTVAEVWGLARTGRRIQSTASTLDTHALPSVPARGR